MSDRKILLTAWASRHFDPPPADRTLRLWVSKGLIYPAPIKFGRAYYVEPNARHGKDAQADESEVAPPPPPEVLHPLRVWAKTPASDCAQMILTRKTKRVAAHESHPEGGCGIYALFKSGRLVYIGRAVNMDARLRKHYMGEHNYDAYACLPLPPIAFAAIEAAHIRALEPPYNRKYEPQAWPGHAEMVQMVREAWGIK